RKRHHDLSGRERLEVALRVGRAVLDHHVTAGDAGKCLGAEPSVKDAFARQLEDQSWLAGGASSLQCPSGVRSPLRGSSRARPLRAVSAPTDTPRPKEGARGGRALDPLRLLAYALHRFRLRDLWLRPQPQHYGYRRCSSRRRLPRADAAALGRDGTRLAFRFHTS